jgi:inhibitor of KinA
MGRDRLPAVRWVSDSALRLEFGTEISSPAQTLVHAAYRALSRSKLPALLDITPAYTTILLRFELLQVGDHEAVLRQVEAIVARGCEESLPPARSLEIPVCYEAEFAIDLPDVARHCGLSEKQVVELHNAASYRVEFLGFSPGFGYLSGLSAQLATPRLDRPRSRIPAGSVAIGGAQTGIYPQETPGGWRIIGRTPLRMFDPRRNPPALLETGDQVRLVPIARAEFDRLAGGA